jgi:hypothetical protein
MNNTENKVMIPEEVIMNKIFIIRGQKVMMDRDLAELYGVETKYLKRQVRRNVIRFPEDFMFELTDKEFEEWRSQFVTSKEDKKGLRYAPMAFTEDGVAQLSTVLNSERAIKVNLQIIRLFSKMRKMILTNKDILIKFEQLEKQVIQNNSDIKVVFRALKDLLNRSQEPINPIGFKIGKNKD